ncbi:FkbM family methyltransferase [candidate division WWE3 bacterium]|jgi:FkbM family methyltransferase|uniref:FkbM family methyltransferase n=1 Tax=candidate division WWE3 bacterium TaxID=2053526 RepID=A0A3A4ZCM5_UNCKA|nr:MAG: FkbM family methyltransferase [candidate division WWE3 bacterium]
MKIFLDVGAHTGETLKIALEDKYKFEKIYCFEPVRECCNEIRKFSDNRVTVCEFGLWDKDGSKHLYNPGSKGASVFKDKFKDEVASQSLDFVRASKWFSENITSDDTVYLKLNCEGAECAILDDLIDSGEYKKINVVMVDFDVRKIPSQKHRMEEMKEKLNKLNIPKVFYIDEYRLGRGTHNFFTHYWLDNS